MQILCGHPGSAEADGDAQAMAALFEIAAEAMLLLDAGDRILAANAAAASLLGARAEDLMGGALPARLPDPAAFAARLAEARSTGKQVRLRERIGQSELELSLVPLGAPGHEGARRIAVIAMTNGPICPEGMAGLFRDIVESQTDLICRFGPDLKLTFANDAYAEFFAREKDSLLGRSLFQDVPDEDHHAIESFLRQLTPEKPRGSIEHRVIMPDGSLRWQQFSCRAFFDAASAVTEYQAVGRDITMRRVAEEALIKVTSEKEKFRLNLEAIFQSIPDGIVTVDTEMRVIESNKALAQVCPVLAARSAGQAVEEGGDHCNSSCHKVLRQTLKTRRPVKEYRVECGQSGSRSGRVVVLNASPLLNARNSFAGAVLVVRDITRLADLEKKLSERHGFQSIIGKSEPMQRIYDLLEQLADVDSTVLVTGESGTGKELAVEALHYGGARSEGPLIKVNCSALSENLLESELFGHVRGSFTGAIHDKVGRFQAADGGTIFLDEIGDISPRIQLKLLRVLERKEFERVGDSKTYHADVRVVAATNVDVLEKVRQGLFREDLYYRLKVMVIHLPPLRERKEDIPLLVEHFLTIFRKSFHKHLEGLSDEVMELFMRYNWPGNIRELKHTIEHACILSRKSLITLQDLPAEMMDVLWSQRPTMPSPVKSARARREDILDAIQRAGGNKAKAARSLGMSRRTLYRKLVEFGIEVDM